MPLTLTRERQRQVDLREFEASLVNIPSFRPVRAIKRDLVSNQGREGLKKTLDIDLWPPHAPAPIHICVCVYVCARTHTHTRAKKKEEYLGIGLDPFIPGVCFIMVGLVV